jgi:hypothetical protein
LHSVKERDCGGCFTGRITCFENQVILPDFKKRNCFDSRQKPYLVIAFKIKAAKPKVEGLTACLLTCKTYDQIRNPGNSINIMLITGSIFKPAEIQINNKGNSMPAQAGHASVCLGVFWPGRA